MPPGSTLTANNLLILFVGVNLTSSSSNITDPSGWTVGVKFASSGAVTCANIYYRIATGSDTSPTISAPTSGARLVGMISQFSGNATSSVLDQTGSNHGTGAYSATAGAADAALGELVCACFAGNLNSNGTITDTYSFNNGATFTATNNNSSSSKAHYCLGWGITTGNSAADSVTLGSATTTTDSSLALASFHLPGGNPPVGDEFIISSTNFAPALAGQSIQRASVM
jgi:hypothetical protein